MADPEPLHKWSDFFSWKMDLLKSIISYIVVTLVTILLFTFYLDRKQHKWEAKYSIKVESLKEFEKESLRYSNMSFDAFAAAFTKGETRENNEDIKTWQDQAYDNLDIAEVSLRHWFKIDKTSHKKINLLLEQQNEQKNKLKELFKSIPEKKKTVSWDDFKINYLAPVRKEFSNIQNQILTECSNLLK